ncbi:hypothetical protein LTR53_002073 [Teratosphaeriaceae sp. CCFEE 6253]|nr:hypothetical protein LTR53_002073 [Teratosphaeriaceae sp. CCFEE 6253]
MEKPSSLVTILAGGIAGASETIVTYPAEFIKTRRQLPAAANASSLSIARSTVATSGISGIYSGCKVLAVSNALKSGIRFYSFESARTNLPLLLPSLAGSPLLNVYAGLCAGVAESIIIVTPGEAVKTKFIHAASGPPSALARLSLTQMIAQVVQREGILGLWKGLGPVVCKQGTNSVVRFAAFGAIQDRLNAALEIQKAMGTTGVTFAAGAASGVVTVYASMPFDNIKTRMQCVGSTERSMLSCARGMLVDEGVRVFWKATTPRLVRLTLSSSITFTAYDWIVRASRTYEGGWRRGAPQLL